MIVKKDCCLKGRFWMKGKYFGKEEMDRVEQLVQKEMRIEDRIGV